MRARLLAAVLGMLAVLGPVGCVSADRWADRWADATRRPVVMRPAQLRWPWQRRSVSPNPLIVPTADFELVWTKTIAVLDEYFEIASENRLSRRIITDPKIGATVFEPWHGDSVGLRERVESSLQTIHRFAIATVADAPGGGYSVKIEVYKELEDLVKPERQFGGQAVFSNQFPINRAREVVGPVPLPVGWIPRGRDSKLEQAILGQLRRELFLP